LAALFGAGRRVLVFALPAVPRPYSSTCLPEEQVEAEESDCAFRAQTTLLLAWCVDDWLCEGFLWTTVVWLVIVMIGFGLSTFPEGGFFNRISILF
jgi:hypothetical protein